MHTESEISIVQGYAFAFFAFDYSGVDMRSCEMRHTRCYALDRNPVNYVTKRTSPIG